MPYQAATARNGRAARPYQRSFCLINLSSCEKRNGVSPAGRGLFAVSWHLP
jgi:hypothetical protein